jgi:ATP-binding cassette subfamily B protein
MIKLFKKYFKGHYLELFLIIVFQLGQSIMNLLLPDYNGEIIDKGVLKGDINYIWDTGAKMLCISLLQVILLILSVYLGARIAIRLGKDVRRDMFKKVMNISTRELTQLGPSSLVTRSTNDIQQFQTVTLFLFTIIISAPISLVGGVMITIYESAKLSTTLLVIIPIIALVALIFVSQVSSLFRVMQKQIDSINEVIRGQISGIRVVRAFVREKTERKRFEAVNENLFDTYMKTGRRMSIVFPMVMYITNIAILAVMWFGAKLIDSNQMQIGSITAFIAYIMYILMSLLLSAMMFVFLPRAQVSAKRINEVLDTESTVIESANPIHIENPKGVIELKDIFFKYPNAQNPVLENISFTAKPNEITAIVGSTGSGKSTIARLIPRLFDPTSGTIKIDGVDTKDLSLDELNKIVGIIPQKAYLFSGTIRSNMLYGKEDATDEEIWSALEFAQAKGFVEETEKGLDTAVSQGGTNFSGGQRQRLSIARAIIKKPLIYQFDDSFSALDYATDSKLRKSLVKIKDVAIIIIAQRVSTIKNANQIIVLDNGRIVGIGTHDELVKSSPVYAEIVESQMSME